MRHSVVSAFFALAFTTGHAAAHIRLEVPKSRYLNDSMQGTKQKQAPCGVTNDARTKDESLITTFKPGEKVTVEWTETINHPGHFRIAFSEKGQSFPAATVEPGEEGGQILAEDIPDDSSKSGGKFSYEITLPNVTCDDCTLQLIQVMTDSGDFYYQCADLVLEGDATGGAGGSGGTGGSSLVPPMGGKSSAGSGGRASGGGGAGGTTGGSGGAGGVSPGTGGVAPVGGSSGGQGGTLVGVGGQTPAAGRGGTVGSTGGTVAAGGSPSATGGTAASAGSRPTPTGGASAAPGAAPSSGDEGGCGIGRSRGSSAVLGLLGLAAAAAFARRRRSALR